MQYEKIDKGKNSKEDYLEVKKIDPNNMKASEGLYRLREVKLEEKFVKTEEATPPKVDLNEKLKELEVKKEKANDYFRKSLIY